MLALRLPLVLLLLAPVLPEPPPAKTVSQKEAEFDKIYSDWVNSELVNIYTFNHTVLRNRVSTRSGWAAGPCLGPHRAGWGADKGTG